MRLRTPTFPPLREEAETLHDIVATEYCRLYEDEMLPVEINDFALELVPEVSLVDCADFLETTFVVLREAKESVVTSHAPVIR